MPSSSDEHVWTTDDFSIASYLHSLGVRLLNATMRPGSRKDYDFHFDDRSGRCADHAIRFLNSEAYGYDQGQRALKKLAFGWQGGPVAGREGSWSTTDFALAAFVLSRGAAFVGFQRTHQHRREYRFCFEGEGIDTLSVAFVNSDAHRFDQSQRALKKLVFGR